MGRRPLALSAPNWPHRAYRLLIGGLSPLALAWLWWRGRKDPGYRENMAQRRGHIEPTPSSIHGILIHAASVGEIQAAQPLIEALRAHWPDHTITVTTQTPTGKRALQSQTGDALQHLFFPVDTPGATARFLERLQPSLVILIEREIWPEWLLQCRTRAIPVALVNARLSAKSAASYQRMNSLMAPVWQGLSQVSAADEASAEQLAALGVPAHRLAVTGNLKFDQSVGPSKSAPASAGQRPMIVAGSTHEGEESALLDAWPALLAQHPAALLVIVPRHPERFDEVAKQIETRGLAYSRRSLQETPNASTSIWLGDTMGELGAWYAQASLSFIGGTLVPVGGHNPLEAMAVGQPVLFGPHTHNAAALYDAIAKEMAGQRVGSASEALQVGSAWLSDSEGLAQRRVSALQFVKRQQGASNDTLQALKALWMPLQPEQLHPVVEARSGSTTIWQNPNLLPTRVPATLFEAPTKDATSLATGSGRGQAQRLSLLGSDVVLRHYRRGGFIARFNPDRYRLSPSRASRAMREFSLLRWMGANGLPVPPAGAARQQVNGRTYTADIIVGMIPTTQNLVQRLTQAPLNEQQWRSIGVAIRAMHDAQVFHSDLNAHNILIDASDKAWIVDFDKCEIMAGSAWKTANLQRLNRSFLKEEARLPKLFWEASTWTHILAGYGADETTARALGPDQRY